MEFWDHIHNNFPDIIEGVLWICSIFIFIIKTIKVKKTHGLIKMTFKEHTDIYQKRDENIRAEMKNFFEESKRLNEETKQKIEENWKEIQDKMTSMQNNFQMQIKIYKESIADIVKNQKELISKGVSENIIKRFELDEQEKTALEKAGKNEEELYNGTQK